MNKQILSRSKKEMSLQKELLEEYKAYQNMEEENMSAEEPSYLVNEVWQDY